MTRGASSMLLFLAIVAVVGFMFWLDRKANSLESQVAPVLADDEEPGQVELTAEELAAHPEAVVGTTGALRYVTVAQRLGRGAFSVQLDSATAYPVLLSSDLIQRGTEIYARDRVTVFGHVFTLNDSIRGEWIAQGAVDAENEGAVPASPSFLMADSLAFN